MASIGIIVTAPRISYTGGGLRVGGRADALQVSSGFGLDDPCPSHDAITGVSLEVLEQGRSLYSYWDECERNAMRQPTKRIPDLEERFLASEAMLYLDESIGTFALSPKNRAEFLAYVTAQEAVNRALVITARFGFARVPNAGYPEMTEWLHLHQPAFSEHLSIQSVSQTYAEGVIGPRFRKLRTDFWQF